MKARIWNSLLAALCAVCMTFGSAALAAEPASQLTTDSVTHELPQTLTTDQVEWYGSAEFCYWKIAVQNRGNADIKIQLYQNGTKDTLIRSMVVPAHSSMSFYTNPNEEEQVLTDGRYHLTILSVGGDTRFDGTLWYRFSTQHMAGTNGSVKSFTSLATEKIHQVQMPYNDGSGQSGVGICSFTADTADFSFAVDFLPDSGAMGQGYYYVQLWQSHPDGTDTKVGEAVRCAFGSGVTWENCLTIGEMYYVKVSSTDVTPDGALCQYTWTTWSAQNS
ncbi:hypothetical protein H7U37_10585 [Pseudoflavonifractor phocaeensis]|uniref:hypothetical protein n=1 Tax=Pseudoflavonifractor phocaeensis TaxID=1870988 RepID=UPI00195A7279|nr:hypothetical protein [Pseudoflavonifractor phocaeensis]MBM6938967.1 hypothetical protein [Pseudoflavonifractor phocaeensis]